MKRSFFRTATPARRKSSNMSFTNRPNAEGLLIARGIGFGGCGCCGVYWRFSALARSFQRSLSRSSRARQLVSISVYISNMFGFNPCLSRLPYSSLTNRAKPECLLLAMSSSLKLSGIIYDTNLKV